jgi:CRISPR-associated protein Cmr6
MAHFRPSSNSRSRDSHSGRAGGPPAHGGGDDEGSGRPLRRQLLANLAPGDKEAFHPAWLLTRGMKVWLEDSTKRGNAKEQVIHDVCESARLIAKEPFYRMVLQRWVGLTADPSRFANACMRLDGRLMIGVSAANALETGVAVHHSYGLPYLPGSALKGCARAHAIRTWGVDSPYVAALFGTADDSAEVAAGSGCVVFHDGWWIPSPADAEPLVPEVVTPHHGDYYGEKVAEPTDFDVPVPSQHIAVQGAFYLAVEGPKAWARGAMRLLEEGLATLGLGAKRAAGYGFWQPAEDNDPAAKTIQDMQGRAQAQAQQALLHGLPAEERVRRRLADVVQDEHRLARVLSTDRARFLESCGDGVDEALLRKVAVEIIDPAIQGRWQTATKKTDKPAYRAWRFLQGGHDDEG